MAQYVLAGLAKCPQYARAEILADDLSINLPDFKVSIFIYPPLDLIKVLKAFLNFFQAPFFQYLQPKFQIYIK